jgi:hypothetical protein
MPPPRRKLTPVEVLQRLLRRLEKRMEALQRVKLDGYRGVISELETEQDYLRRAIRYLEEWTKLRGGRHGGRHNLCGERHDRDCSLSVTPKSPPSRRALIHGSLYRFP